MSVGNWIVEFSGDAARNTLGNTGRAQYSHAGNEQTFRDRFQELKGFTTLLTDSQGEYCIHGQRNYTTETERLTRKF